MTTSQLLTTRTSARRTRFATRMTGIAWVVGLVCSWAKPLSDAAFLGEWTFDFSPLGIRIRPEATHYAVVRPTRLAHISLGDTLAWLKKVVVPSRGRLPTGPVCRQGSGNFIHAREFQRVDRYQLDGVSLKKYPEISRPLLVSKLRKQPALIREHTAGKHHLATASQQLAT